MLFILDKLKDLWENSCRCRSQLRLSFKLMADCLFGNGGRSRTCHDVIKISQLEIYWNTCWFLFVLPQTTRIPYFPLESDTMEMKRGEVAVAGDTVLPRSLCSFECNILQVSLFLFFFFFPYVSQPQLHLWLLECAEPSECRVWFPWRFHAACDSAKTQHALTSRAPAAALVLFKHTEKQYKLKNNSWCDS